MAYGRQNYSNGYSNQGGYNNNRNYGNNNGGYQKQPEPELTVEEKIKQRLENYLLIISIAADMGISREEIAPYAGAWATSVSINDKKGNQ